MCVWFCKFAWKYPDKFADFFGIVLVFDLTCCRKTLTGNYYWEFSSAVTWTKPFRLRHLNKWQRFLIQTNNDKFKQDSTWRNFVIEKTGKLLKTVLQCAQKNLVKSKCHLAEVWLVIFMSLFAYFWAKIRKFCLKYRSNWN